MDRHDIERSSSREKHNKLYTFPLNKGAVDKAHSPRKATHSTAKVTHSAVDKAHSPLKVAHLTVKETHSAINLVQCIIKNTYETSSPIY